MPRMTFLNWDKPLLNQLVHHLTSTQQEIENKIIIVPTVQSGRELRKALAHAGIGLSPRVTTPEILLPNNNPGNRAANIAAWTQTLLSLNLEKARGLFPKDPPEGVIHSFRWAFNVAKQLTNLQNTLLENNKTFQEISRRSIESERWQDLAKIDNQVTSLLRKWRIPNKQDNTLNNIPSHKQIIIAGVCDLSPIAIAQLNKLSEANTPIEIIIHAPETHRQHFDQWGRPLSEYWNTCTIPINHWKDNVTLAENPTLAAKHTISQIAKKQLSPNQITLALCDRDMVLPIQQQFSKSGWNTYDPEGTSTRSSSLILFLTALTEWLTANEKHPISAFAKLIRLPEMEAFIPDQMDRYTLTRELDLYLKQRLTQKATEINHHLQNSSTENYQHLKHCLNHFIQETQKMLTGNKIRGLRGWIAKLLNRTKPEIASILVDDIADIIDAFEKIETHNNKKGLDITQAIEILIEIITQKKSYIDTNNSTTDLLGWMELIYQDAPNLFLTGLHEGQVPQYSGDDPFLPDNFREMLEMESGNINYARDSYILKSLTESRENIHITLSKLNTSSDPNTPSRLLLRTNGKELAERVQSLFGEPQIQSSNPSAWQRDWQLNIPNISNPYSTKNKTIRALSPSALKDYLNCPFRFYLKRIVRMERYEANKKEMNALDFGLLVHAVVEKFGLDTSIRHSTSAKKIQLTFDSLLEKEMFARFGPNPNLALKIQAEIAKSRLHSLANIQAEQTAAGWQIIDVELDIGNTIHWDINGHPIKMQIDRVDRHQQTGEIRVIDYKTSGSAKPPLQAHIDNLKPEENRPICGPLLPPSKKNSPEKIWKNLQLPIYAWFAQEHYKCSEIPQIGYIQMPNTLSETSFQIWDNFNHDLLQNAKEWTTQAIQNIQQNNLFSPANPPKKQENWDEFSKLAQGNLALAFGLE